MNWHMASDGDSSKLQMKRSLKLFRTKKQTIQVNLVLRLCTTFENEGSRLRWMENLSAHAVVAMINILLILLEEHWEEGGM